MKDEEWGNMLNNINVPKNFRRTEINELGRRGPYHRSIIFPVEVTDGIITRGLKEHLHPYHYGIKVVQGL